MAKYKAYPEYKDSGVEWLGEIPTHWICTQIKYGYDITLGKMLQKNKSSSKDELKPYLKAQNIQPTGIDLSVVDNMWFSPDEKNKLLLKNDDVLISEGGDVGRSALWQGQLVECYIQNAINRARAIKGNSPYFLNYWMVYLKSADFINTLCNKATIAHYTAEKVETSPLLLPNSDEQFHISLFLDHETAKIDSLIEKQQQLIELLKEKRQAVISHAVTKGLNPDAPMKDSGVEWLGEVPEHWTVSTIKHISTFIGTGGTPKNSESFTDDDGIDWFSPGDFNGSLALRHAKKKITTQAVSNGDAKSYPKDSIVVIGIGATLGKVAFVDHEFSCNQQINIITPSKTVDHKYLTYSLLNQVEQMKQSSNASTIGIMNQEKTKQIWIAFPPKDEQIKILSVLSQKEIEFDELLKKSEYQILLLQERRTALISAAVTGKIDVRDWVAPDTQDVEEPEEATE
ncbi:TPA: restriction endonuclease subunit S [Citrobacter braakii]